MIDTMPIMANASMTYRIIEHRTQPVGRNQYII